MLAAPMRTGAKKVSKSKPLAILATVVAAVTAVSCGNASTDSASAATCRLTPSATEGPYYKAGAPRRTDINQPRQSGRTIVLTGLVRTNGCRAIAGAKLELWQANAAGDYDNTGYKLRGWVRTNASGRYRIVTIIPGIYEGRTRHIHVKVTAPGGPTLTSQLYFPGTAQNNSDSIFNSRTLLTITSRGNPWRARYNFAVRT